jgi:hypothetical protein
MSRFLILLAFASLSASASARIQGVVTCRPASDAPSSQQSRVVQLDFDDLLGSWGGDGNTVFSWSLTECEDYTTLTVDNESLRAFESGSSASFTGSYSYEGPDLDVPSDGPVTCSR